MMINHAAIWASDLETLKDFYIKYFNGKSSHLYHNPNTGFNSYFLSFEGGAQLELMQSPAVKEARDSLDKQYLGFAHLSFSVGAKEAVDSLTETLVGDGFTLAGGPRTTGDGYYESCILDPEQNRIEITI